MSGHTPGPWLAEAAQRGYIITAKGGQYDIAVVRDIGNDSNLDNAILIASAPDLLDALMQWRAADRDNDQRKRMSARRSRDAAIAKAKGYQA